MRRSRLEAVINEFSKCNCDVIVLEHNEIEVVNRYDGYRYRTKLERMPARKFAIKTILEILKKRYEKC